MITIITVTLNNIKGLKKTINSIRRQTYADWEVVVKDGSSIDGTIDFCKELQSTEDRLRFFSSKDNGIYDAMNIAIKKASGEFIIFMNAGDVFENTKVLKEFNSFAPLNIADIYFGHTIMSMFDKKFFRPAKSAKYLDYGQPALHQSTFYRTNIHKENLFLLEYEISSDYATTLSMYCKGASTIIFPFTVSEFEIDTQSTSFKNQKQSRTEMMKAQRELLKLNIVVVYFYNLRRLIMNKLAKLYYFILSFKE